MAKKKYNIRAKKITKVKPTPKKESKKKSNLVNEIPFITPPNIVTIIPPSPSVLETNLKKRYFIPFQINEKEFKELLRKKVEEGMDENHAYFLYRCKREKKSLQVYYDILMSFKDDWKKT